MKLNTSGRGDIDDASRVDCSSILFQERGQAENDEYEDGRQLISAYLDVTGDGEESVSKAIAAGENEHER
jgi:hypothetical protein